MKESELSDESGRRTRSAERGDKAEPVASPSPDQSSDEQYLDFREEWQADASDSVRPAVEGRSRLEQGKETTRGHAASQEGVDAPIDGPERPEFPVDAPIPSKVSGIARSVEVRELRDFQQQSTYTLRFRLDRYDAYGNRLAPVGVEMRNYRRGQLTDGDEVEVTGSPQDGTLIAKRIVNLTTGSKVLRGVQWLKSIMIVWVILVVAASTFFVIYLWVSGSGPFSVLSADNVSVPNLTGGDPGASGSGPGSVFPIDIGSVPGVNGVDPGTSGSGPGKGFPADNVSVPNLTGGDLQVATQKLEAAGLYLGVDLVEPSSSVPFGQVIRSDPPAGTSVPPGSLITLFVSSGPVSTEPKGSTGTKG